MQKSKADNMVYVIMLLGGLSMTLLTISSLVWAMSEFQNINVPSLLPALLTGLLAAFCFTVAIVKRPNT